MPDEVLTPSTTTETPAPVQADPESLDAADYRNFRETGKVPEQTKTSAAAEEAATTEPDSETGEEGQEHEEKPKKKGGFQRRIDQLVKENAELKGRLAGDPAAKPQDKPADTPTKPAAEGKPQAKDFDSYEDYVEKLADWKLDQREQAKAEAAAKAKAETEANAISESWDAKKEAARERYEDFDEVIMTDAKITPPIEHAILASENGADLAYYLGKNPAERERINGLNPVAATLALGKILAKLEGAEATPEDKKPKVSAAPAPIKPLGTKAAVAAKRPEDLSPDEYRKARESGKIR